MGEIKLRTEINMLEKSDGSEGSQSERKKVLGRTLETVSNQLRSMYSVWKTTHTEQDSFNNKWIRKHDGPLLSWMQENGGIDKYLLEAGEEIMREYRRIAPKKRTIKEALKELEEAHKIWKDNNEAGSDSEIFSATWLEKNFSKLATWLKQNGGISYFINSSSDSVKSDFKRKRGIDRTRQGAIRELQIIHSVWKSIPQGERGGFTKEWIESNTEGLVDWVQRHGKFGDFIEVAGPEVKKDYRSERQENRTIESAADELREVYSKWKALPVSGRSPFNMKWLRKNAAGLHAWSYIVGGMQKIVDAAGADIVDDFEIKVAIRNRTFETALQELKLVYEKWKKMPPDGRGVFNALRIDQIDHSLFSWMKKNGGIDFFIKKSSEDLVKDFTVRKLYDRSDESILQELKDVHAVWKALPQDGREKFNAKWISENAYSLAYWLSSHGGFAIYIQRLGIEIQNDFSEKVSYDEGGALNSLRDLHNLWKSLPEKERQDFSISWLTKMNAGLYNWMLKHGGVEKNVELAGENISRDFRRIHTPNRSVESMVEELKSTYEIWNSLPENSRSIFGVPWLKKNNSKLYHSMRQKGNTKEIFLKAGEPISRYFQETIRYSEEYVLAKLQEAYNDWCAIPEQLREPFTVKYLLKKSKQIYYWICDNGGIDYFIAKLGNDVSKDFVKMRRMSTTSESIIEELKLEHSKWKSISESERGDFDILWLSTNAKSLLDWTRRHGGLDLYIAKAGNDVAADFKRKRIDGRTEDSAKAELLLLYQNWKKLDIVNKSLFTTKYIFDENPSLYNWLNQRGGVAKFITVLGGELSIDYKNKEQRTFESAVQELKEAYFEWKNNAEFQPFFNVSWLQKNGYVGLYKWMYKNKLLDSVVLAAGDEVISNFNRKHTHNPDLENSFNRFLAVSNNEELVNYKNLIKVFGNSRVIDLLYKFRPEFKGLSIEYIRSSLAQYLGDFLSAKQEFRIKDIGAAAEFLSETTLREGLYETMKDHCLQYYFEKRRQGATGDSYEIIYNYLVHITDELHGVSNKFLDDVIEDVVSYFNSAIQEFKKPEKFVDRLSDDREFPDLNQRINMKELADKKRMLIADEMGLGKSASVIMAKENLRLGCALVIVPKIVQQTWQDYLSDDIARKGYFKKGQAPRVLVVDGVKDLEGVTKKDFDYIIISQAKLNGRYAPLLENLDPDMLIVDESHKLKNGKGVHTNVLLPLARKLEGEGKYLAMLTGTPIPNKVNDIAVALKLLYPDQFGETPISELTATIIKGDLIDLRSLLVPRMQMKELKDVIEMPEREQKIASIPLSSAERDVYEALLELDEITAFEKMKALRTFLLNPALVDVEPGIRSSKFEALQNKLMEAYKTKSKVLVVVNDYVTGVMRGKEFLFQQLQLPPDVSVEFIHGDDGSRSNKNIRPDLQRRFNETPEKMLLIVNGAAADVGISLVGAEETIIYNEPWTESDLMQQKARVFRQGLDHPITETTLLVRDSIEEGLHEYIAKKHKAVEKILKGIPISELEMRMVELGEKSQEEQVSDINFEVNPEMARHYFSVKNRLLQMFAHMKQRGEESIREFLDTWGVEYAEGYRQVGARSVQANTNRVTGALIGDMITASGRHPAALHILDVASGPEMLRRHIGDSLQASVYSLDINKHHFEHGTLGKTYVGGWTKMPFKPHSFDYLNCAMAFQDSEFVPSKRKFERLDVLREMNRVLKTGGRAVISMIYSMEMNDMEKFRLFAEAVGFKIVSDYTGSADLEERFHSQVITLEKIADSEKTSEQVISEVGIEHRHGLKMHKTNKKLRNDRKVLAHGFFLDGKSKPILLNSRDRAVSAEETEVESEIAMLKSKYKAIKDVPIQEIIDRGYMRILVGKKYHLFRRLTKAPGIIILS